MAMYVEPVAFLLNNRDDVIKVCEILAQEENLKVTVKESLNAGLITGLGAVLGGLIGGRVGVALGGTVAAIAAAATCDEFKSLVEVIQDMSPEQKDKLAGAVLRVLGNVRTADYLSLMRLIRKSAMLKEGIIQEIGSFLSSEMNMSLVQ